MRRPNTFNLLARLRRSWRHWKLERDATGYTCVIHGRRRWVGKGKLMGEAIEKALACAEARDVGRRREKTGEQHGNE